jgi:hypothetical protein
MPHFRAAGGVDFVEPELDFQGRSGEASDGASVNRDSRRSRLEISQLTDGGIPPTYDSMH